MRFGETLGTHLTPEWRSQYVQYEELKKILYDADAKAPLIENIGEEGIQKHFSKYEDSFFKFCDSELAKVNTFFAEKLAEAVRKFNELQTVVANAGSNSLNNQRTTTVIENSNSDFSVTPDDDNDDEEDISNIRSPRRLAPGSTMTTTAPTTPRFMINKKKLREMRFVVCEFYLSLVLIQNFQEKGTSRDVDVKNQKLNFTAFRKILKKHDKMFHTTSGVEYRIAKVEKAGFYANRGVDELILSTEHIAIEDLEDGNRAKAMKRLRVLPLSEKQTTSSSYLWGLFSGSFAVLFIVVAISAYFKGRDLFWEPAVRMYRGLFIVMLMFALLGVNMHGWAKAGVNHVLIFELDPRHHLSYVDLLMLASFFGALWCISGLAFLFSGDFDLPAYAHPLALSIFCLIYLFNPTKTFHYRSRRWLLRVLFRILTAPYYPVKFADFWLADQLNSLVVPLLDFQFVVCFYSHGWYQSEDNTQCTNPKYVIRPIIALLPAWFRFAQCLRRYRDTRKAFPHLVNAGKYSTSMFVTVISTIASVKDAQDDYTSALFYVWIVSLIIGTCYTLTWDIKMDWGLFAENAGENRFLREQIVYNYTAYYYLAMLSDLLFRFLWTLTVSIGTSSFVHQEFFVFFIAICECVRRFIWNFFRLENEHLNNVGEFRAVRDISIKPIFEDDDVNKNDQQSIEKMMDAQSEPSRNTIFTKDSVDSVEFMSRNKTKFDNRRGALLKQITFSNLLKNIPTGSNRPDQAKQNRRNSRYREGKN